MRSNRATAVIALTAPIEIRFLDDPRRWAGRLVSGAARGQPVHAGTYPRKRLIILDRALLGSPRELNRILAHELFHLAWLRLGNPRRRDWERLLAAEIRSAAAGELGWSSEWRKDALRRQDPAGRTRRWREYACESFCDTAAWLLAGAGRHAEFTLPGAARRERRRWFGAFLSRPVSI